MAQRKRIALIFRINKNWMGGTYYILNLINALNSLPDPDKPRITLLVNDKSDYEYVAKHVPYPYMDYRDVLYSHYKLRIIKIINKVFWSITGRNIFSTIPFREQVDVVYPLFDITQYVKGSPNLMWIPDFQERYLPQFFSHADLHNRDSRAKRLKDKGMTIVFSSEDARKDYLQFYNGDKSHTKLFRFAARIPIVHINTSEVMSKYAVTPNKYYFCANQFWVHKNHLTLFEAIRILRDTGHPISLLCSGNNTDYRSKDYYPTLLNFIHENNLSDNIRLLGLINRDEQLSLMKECRALIQPSLFEGWSTSIEEAKSMDKFMILSDLPVHKEQATQNVLFFKRDNPQDLASKILNVENVEPKIISNNYSDLIRQAGENFMKIVSSLGDK